MLKRHSDELDASLEGLVYEPMIKLSKRKLRFIYEMERLSKNIWRDIASRLEQWPKLGALYVIDDEDDFFIIKAIHLQKGADFLA